MVLQSEWRRCPQCWKRPRWFELDSLVEQAEFVLPCGLQSAVRRSCLLTRARSGGRSFLKEMPLPECFQSPAWQEHAVNRLSNGCHRLDPLPYRWVGCRLFALPPPRTRLSDSRFQLSNVISIKAPP